MVFYLNYIFYLSFSEKGIKIMFILFIFSTKNSGFFLKSYYWHFEKFFKKLIWRNYFEIYLFSFNYLVNPVFPPKKEKNWRRERLCSSKLRHICLVCVCEFLPSLLNLRTPHMRQLMKDQFRYSCIFHFMSLI